MSDPGMLTLTTPLAKRRESNFNGASLEFGKMRSIRPNEMVSIMANRKWTVPKTLVAVLRDPVACGFFKANCEACFSDENISFWIKSNELKALHNVDGSVPKENAAKIKETVKEIYETYIVDDSSKWLSLPASISQPLLKNMSVAKKETYTLFNKAMDKTLQCLNHDVLPRFLASAQFRELESMYAKINAGELKVEIEGETPEVVTVIGQIDLRDENFTPSLEQALKDQFILDEFVEEAKRRHCAESILCWRDIQLYKFRFDKKKRPLEVKSRAWHIFTTYLIPMSKYEISYNSLERNDLALQLANPAKDTFDKVENSCLKLIKHDLWPTFMESKAFKSLANMLRIKAKEMTGKDFSNSKSCLIQ